MGLYPVSAAADSRIDQPQLEPRREETVATVLERARIPPDDVYHLFLNEAILAARNSMAAWLLYQCVPSGSVGRPVTAQQLDTRVYDRYGLRLFARDGALLVV